MAPVPGPGDHAAAGGHHQGMPVGDRIEHGGFQVAEAGFAVAGEDLRDGAAGRLGDDAVGVDEAIAQGFGQGATHRALAGPHHADQIEVETLQPLGQLACRGGGRSHGSDRRHFRLRF